MPATVRPALFIDRASSTVGRSPATRRGRPHACTAAAFDHAGFGAGRWPRSAPRSRRPRRARRATSRSPSTTTISRWCRTRGSSTIPAGRSRQEFPDVSAQIRPETVTLTGAGHRHRRAEFRFRPALAPGADGESGRRDDHPGPHQPRHRRRDARAGAGARRQWRRRPPDRRADRGAARRRPAGPRDLRSGARESARPPDPVGHRRRASAPAAGR